MADPEDSSDPGTILLGPGARAALLLPLLRALLPADGAGARQLADLSLLLDTLPGERVPGGFLLLDADEVPLEDLGLVRRFLDRHGADGWVLLLTGDDPSTPVARRLLARAAAATWLPWPVDVEELQAVARGAALASSPPSSPPSAGEAMDAAAATVPAPAPQREPDPEPDPELDDDLESRLGRELSAIESILRAEEGLLPEPEHAPEESPSRAPRSGLDLSGLELSREEMEAFLGPLDEPEPARREPNHDVGREPARADGAEEDEAESEPAAETSTATEPPPTADEDEAPPSWYRAQIADLADLAQGLGLSLHALREANQEEGEEAAALRDESIERVGDGVFRLIQFTRTLGFLAAPPGRGDQRLALDTLVEELLGGLAGAGPDSPRYLFRSEDDVNVRCDKALVVQALDALLHVADACADATDVVRVGVHDGDGRARVRIDFPAGPAAGVAPSRALQPYGLRRELPGIGPNALAAASRLFAGQGGRLSLGRGGPGRLVFEAELPKA